MQTRTIDIDGPVHLLEYPGPDTGPTFVCVHGLGGSHANWLALAPLLAARGRVLVVDLAGHGFTPLGQRSASVHANRMLLDRFLGATVGAPAILVGNSMGGAISILQAHGHPGSVAGLVLVDPALPRGLTGSVDRTVAAMFATYMIPRAGEAFIARRLRTLGPERVAMETLKLCCVDPGRVPAEVVEAGLGVARARATMPWATTAFLQAARSLVRLLARRQRFARMVHQIAAPTLLMMGRHDRLVPLAAADAVAAARPDWEYVVFDHLGHVPMLEDAPATMRAIEAWLTGPASRLLTGAPGLSAS